MCTPTIALIGSAVTGLMGSIASYSSQQSQADAAASAANANAQVAASNAAYQDQLAADAYDLSSTKKDELRQSYAQLEGENMTSYASSGVSTLGSPTQAIADNAAWKEFDINVINENADREAYGHQVQASNYRVQQQQQQYMASNASSGNSLLGSLVQGLSGVGSAAMQIYS